MVQSANDVVDLQAIGTHNILLIDDQRDSAKYTREVLEEAGCDVRVAHDGGMAHSIFSMHKPDFVVSELILPGESGFEIIERLRIKDEEVPIMVLSAITLERARALAARVGADGYLTKPFEKETLLKMVRDIAHLAYERKHGDDGKVSGRIRFACPHCGKKFQFSLASKGKSIVCPKCSNRVVAPRLLENERMDMIASTQPQMMNETQPVSGAEPLRYVMIKCQNCSTYYHLFPNEMHRSRTCPRCHQKQTGSLSIAGVPLARAALASSPRVLVICSGKHKGKKLLLPNKGVTLGSADDCDIKLTTPGVEPHHCEVVPLPDGIHVRNSSDASETYLNDQKIADEVILRPGDVLRVGRMKLQLSKKHARSKIDETVDAKNEEAVEGETHRVEQYELHYSSMAAEAAAVIQEHWEMVRK